MSVRLWLPQLDVYDGIRRISCLLSGAMDMKFGLERLYILDFFLANPVLLHSTHMPQKIRDVFHQMAIPKPSQLFLSYPSAPILFQKMEPIQKQAFQTLVAKGLVDREQLSRGTIAASTPIGKLAEMARLQTQDEGKILQFLLQHFATIGSEDVAGLRKSTGLRRVC